MRKYFKTEQLIPCYSEEGRCKWCRRPLLLWSSTLHKAIGNAWAMADYLLEPTRVRYGKPIRVKRCFMCYNKCKKLGLDEAYMKGEVAEITAVAGMPRKRRFSGSSTSEAAKPSAKFQVSNGMPDVTREENLKIAEIIKELDFDQLVIYPDHLQVSYKRDGSNRHEVINCITKE